MKVKNNSREKGISRIDSGSTHGWFVRAYRNGKTFSKLFSDRKMGSQEKAYEAAVAYRNSLHQQVSQMPREPRKRRLVLRDSRNKTGVIGVTRTARKLPNGTVTEAFSVSWRPAPGVQKCTSFSIRKYGEEGAFKRAVQHRLEKVEEAYGAEVAKQWIEELDLKKYLS